MKVHANAALGPAGGLALVQAIESGVREKGGGAALCGGRAAAPRRLLRGARDRAPLVASMEGRGRGGAALGELDARPFIASPAPATTTHRGRGGADPAGPSPDQPRSRPSRRDLSPRPLDDLEGAASSRA